MRFFQAKDGRIGGFLLGDVFAGSFAEGRGGFFHVENVVGDLKGPADGFAEAAKPSHVFRGSAGAERAGSYGSANEGGGFRAMNIFEHFGPDRFAFGFDVGNLPADHAVYGAGGS